jgi:putative DNA primase/helicase
MTATATTDQESDAAEVEAPISSSSPISEVERKARANFAEQQFDLLGDEDEAVRVVAGKYDVPEREAREYIAAGVAERERKALWERWGVFQTDPDTKRTRFYATKLAELIEDETPIAAAPDRTLYWYRSGVYLPGAEGKIKRRIQSVLGDKWASRAESEVLSYLGSARELIPFPSRDNINCRNGVYNLETGKLEPHSPEDRTPVQIGAAYDPAATCPNVEKFLADVLPDPEDRQLIREIAGYLLVPDNRLRKAFMLTGIGRNGKTTVLKLLEQLMGPGNVSHLSLHKLVEDRFAAAELYGRQANICGDIDRRALASASLFKEVVGGDPIHAERKHRDPFSFEPYARLLFSANELPPTPDGSPAFYDRWIVIPFPRRFSDAEADETLFDRLTTPEELSGLLNLAIRALGELRERGHFRETASTTDAASRFKVETDSVAGFLAEAATFAPEAWVSKANLFAKYKRWCEQNNRGALGKQKFNERLRADHPQIVEKQGNKAEGDNGLRGWGGVGLSDGGDIDC